MSEKLYNALRDGEQSIEFPPLDQQHIVTQALLNDQIPNLENAASNPAPNIQDQFEFPVTSMDQLPRYDAEYNPMQQEQLVQAAPQRPQEHNKHEDEQRQEQESRQARNFRELKMQMAQRDRELEELRELIRNQKQTALAAQEEEEPEMNYDPDDLANGAHLNSMTKQIKKLEKQVKLTQKQSEEARKKAYALEIEHALRNQYPDFNSVMSKSNIDKLASQYGPLAQSIANDPDYYNQLNAAYMAIKSTGIAQAAEFEPKINKVQNNINKPRPLASISPQQAESPLARANAFAEGLTTELQKQLLKEMNQARMRL